MSPNILCGGSFGACRHHISGMKKWHHLDNSKGKLYTDYSNGATGKRSAPQIILRSEPPRLWESYRRSLLFCNDLQKQATNAYDYKQELKNL